MKKPIETATNNSFDYIVTQQFIAKHKIIEKQRSELILISNHLNSSIKNFLLIECRNSFFITELNGVVSEQMFYNPTLQENDSYLKKLLFANKIKIDDIILLYELLKNNVFARKLILLNNNSGKTLISQEFLSKQIESCNHILGFK